MGLVIEFDGNPFKGWDDVEAVSRPTETQALKLLYRWYAALRATKNVQLTPLHSQLMRLEAACWKKNFHWTRDDVIDVYAVCAVQANLYTFDEKGKRVPDTKTVEYMLEEASLLCYLQEYGVSESVEETREFGRRAA